MGVLLVEVQEGGVVLLTFNKRERMNAWGPDLEGEFFEALNHFDADPSCRAIVVTGAGHFFCAGADAEFTHDGKSQGQDQATLERFERAKSWKYRRFADIRKMRTPVICCINGACVGFGFSLAVACDMRFAAKGAKIGVVYPQRGLIAEEGSAFFLPHLIGTGNAMMLLMTGDVFPAEELPPGLIQKVIPKDKLLSETLDFAKRLATLSAPTSVSVIKRQTYVLPHKTADEALALTDQIQRSNLFDYNPDHAEGIAAFGRNQPPNFGPFNPEMPFVKLTFQLLQEDASASGDGGGGGAAAAPQLAEEPSEAGHGNDADGGGNGAAATEAAIAAEEAAPAVPEPDADPAPEPAPEVEAARNDRRPPAPWKQFLPRRELTRRPRVLCLHGTASGKEIMEKQFARLFERWGKEIDFLIVEGPKSCPTRPRTSTSEAVEVMTQFYPGKPMMMYDELSFDDKNWRCYKKVSDTLFWLQSMIKKFGPFDGAFGFSTGANFAVMLAAMSYCGTGKGLSFVVAMSPQAPGYKDQAPELFVQPLMVPALIIRGEQEEYDDGVKKFLRGKNIETFGERMVSEHVAKLFQDPEVFTHPDGPRPMPVKPSDQDELVERITQFILENASIEPVVKQ